MKITPNQLMTFIQQTIRLVNNARLDNPMYLKSFLLGFKTLCRKYDAVPSMVVANTNVLEATYDSAQFSALLNQGITSAGMTKMTSHLFSTKVFTTLHNQFTNLSTVPTQKSLIGPYVLACAYELMALYAMLLLSIQLNNKTYGYVKDSSVAVLVKELYDFISSKCVPNVKRRDFTNDILFKGLLKYNQSIK